MRIIFIGFQTLVYQTYNVLRRLVRVLLVSRKKSPITTIRHSPNLSISPSNPAAGDDLVASIDVPASDPDGGPSPITYDYAWTLNGNPMPAYSGLTTIPAADTVALDTWAVYVTASDGQATSQPGSAAVAIGNSVLYAVAMVGAGLAFALDPLIS